ncbi:sterol esterase [Malassezia cuniculi]|uniref:Sterol esterase n=1 Tax=Malassezia cuniculi TaxID=948313 RepID=A0AAF0J7C2_9BASI|nr:sterol esterase [Malassezia cuniculi]
MSTLDPRDAAEKAGILSEKQPLDMNEELSHLGDEVSYRNQDFGNHETSAKYAAPSEYSDVTAFTAATAGPYRDAAEPYHDDVVPSYRVSNETTRSENDEFEDAPEGDDDLTAYHDAPSRKSRKHAPSSRKSGNSRRPRSERNANGGGAHAYHDNLGRHDEDGDDVEHDYRMDHGVPIEMPHTAAQAANHNVVQRPQDTTYFDPQYHDAQDEEVESFPAFFHHPVGEYGDYNIFSRLYLEIRQFASLMITLQGLLIVMFLAYGRYMNPMRKKPPKARTDLEYERRITGERLSERMEYYAEYWGYKCEEHEIVTAGGWILKAYRISDPRRGNRRGYPVVLQHGILCTSLFFFTAEERSLGFWLVDQGFDVWATNIRSNYGAGHVKYNRWDPRFWAWGVHELADDLVDVVNYVVDASGYRQVAYVGHSQGTGSMFLSLATGYHPELGYKLSSFTALGPAVYPGPSLSRLPFKVMRMFHSRHAWSLLFGVRDFMPPLSIVRAIVPSYYFGHIAYVMFGYLFDFNDHNWVNRQKPKVFRAAAVTTSAELLYFYMASFVYRGCIFDPTIKTPWFPRSFPPLTVVYGTTDYLVLGKPLVDRLLQYERNVEIVHILELQGYEHMDMVFGCDAYKVVFPKIKDTIVRTMDIEDGPVDVL